MAIARVPRPPVPYESEHYHDDRGFRIPESLFRHCDLYAIMINNDSYFMVKNRYGSLGPCNASSFCEALRYSRLPIVIDIDDVDAEMRHRIDPIMLGYYSRREPVMSGVAFKFEYLSSEPPPEKMTADEYLSKLMSE